jgi:hypothetical protein
MSRLKKYYKKATVSFLQKLYLFFGFKLNIGKINFKYYRCFRRDLNLLKLQASQTKDLFPITKLWPLYSDKDDSAGSVSQYFYQDLFVAQRIFENNPETHVDVGSRIDGFVAHVAAFRKILVFDIRDLKWDIPNVTFQKLDLMDPQGIDNESIDSISCLHALEHFGLGRYGDLVCYDGHLKGFSAMTKMLKKGGILYLSVPLGQQRIEFHAHRVFSLSYLVDMVEPDYEILHFSYIDDDSNLYPNVLIKDGITNNFGCQFGCAIFELKKK